VEAETKVNSEEKSQLPPEDELHISKYMCLLFLAVRHLNAKFPIPSILAGCPPAFSVHSDGVRFGVSFIRDVVWDSAKYSIDAEPYETLVSRFIRTIMNNVILDFSNMKNVILDFSKLANKYVEANPDDPIVKDLHEIIMAVQKVEEFTPAAEEEDVLEGCGITW
jgi:hypothetical protein